jgi:protein-disulfide isomerase
MANERTGGKAEPLVWGHGPTTFEAFLEPTCPFSARAFPKLFDLLTKAGEERLSVKVRLQSQPWHLFSPFICRAIFAASTTAGGRDAAKKVMESVFADREAFEFKDHCSGPNMEETPNRLIARIEKASGVKIAEAFRIPDLDREMKWHAKYGRQNGVHVSPTFMVDGLIRNDISSGDDVAKWLQAIGLA